MRIPYSFGYPAALVAAGLLAACIFDDSRAKGGHVVENEVLAGTLYAANGDPAANAEIKAFPVDQVPNKGLIKTGADTTFIYTFRTDAKGRYSAKTLPAGVYNFMGRKEGDVSYLDSVLVNSETDSLPSDTLGAPGSVVGLVILEPNHDPQSVFIQVLGTDLFTTADGAGRFLFSGLAEGSYSIRIVTTIDGYTPYPGRFQVRSGKTDTLPQGFRLAFTGIPVVRGLVAAYDTANAMARLTWNKTDFAFFKEYLVYRDAKDALTPSILPIDKVRDTFYVDTLTGLAPGPFDPIGAGPEFEYRVAVRNLSNIPGLSFGSVVVKAVSAASVATRALIHRAGEGPLRVSVGDTLLLAADWSNPGRGNDSLAWLASDRATTLRSRATDGFAGSDTLEWIAPRIPGFAGPKLRMRDAVGSIWWDSIRIEVILDAPTLEAKGDTIVSIGDRIRLSAVEHQEFGRIVKREWRLAPQGAFVAASGTDTMVTVPGAPGSYYYAYRATDDDGNIAETSIRADVLLDPPVADAGTDTLVTISDSVWLRSKSFDGFGRIAKLEWNIGPGGAFVPVSGDTTVISKSSVGYEVKTLRVTDDDGNVAMDSMRIAIIDDKPFATMTGEAQSESKGGGYIFKAYAQEKGRIVKWEWDPDGDGIFVEGSGPDTVFHPTQEDGLVLNSTVRVTDDDGNSHTADSRPIIISKWRYETTGADMTEYTRLVAAGRVLYSYGSSSQTFKGYDLETRTWSTPIPYPGWQPVNFLGTMGDQLWAFSHDGVYQYVPPLQSWEPQQVVANGVLPWFTCHGSPASFETVFVFPANGREGCQGGLYFDTKNREFTRTKTLPTGMSWISTTTLDGKVYAAASLGSPPASASLFEFLPGTLDWKLVFNYDPGFMVTAIAGAEGKIHSVAKDAAKRQWTLTYEIQTGAHSQKSPPLLGTVANMIAVADGKFFMPGGAPNGSHEFTPIRAVQSYDFASEP